MTSVELSVVEQASKPMILDDEGVQVKKDSDDIAADSHTSLSCNCGFVIRNGQQADAGMECLWDN
jgi:hypothetical protein